MKKLNLLVGLAGTDWTSSVTDFDDDVKKAFFTFDHLERRSVFGLPLPGFP